MSAKTMRSVRLTVPVRGVGQAGELVNVSRWLAVALVARGDGRIEQVEAPKPPPAEDGGDLIERKGGPSPEDAVAPATAPKSKAKPKSKATATKEG